MIIDYGPILVVSVSILPTIRNQSFRVSGDSETVRGQTVQVRHSEQIYEASS
jgi:hypothetical protein